MVIENAEVIVVGSGPAGLAAAIECAKAGAKTLVFDENPVAGGQLVKQIHKFFGSEEHQAGTRGYVIAENMLREAKELGIEILTDAPVWGLLPQEGITIKHSGKTSAMDSKKVVIATGAREKGLAFPGWTLPGVITAGAAQTMVNIHRVKPGERFLIIGSGNVGLIIAYQLLLAGIEVAGIVEVRDHIGGYEVHASKLRRIGIPIYLERVVREARGQDRVEEVIIRSLHDSRVETIQADGICLAVGMEPMTELLLSRGCVHGYYPELGGFVPLHNEEMETSIEGIYVAGDVAGVEEASVAIEEGRLAGVCCAGSLGLIGSQKLRHLKMDAKERLDQLREGPFGESRRLAKERMESNMKKGVGYRQW